MAVIQLERNGALSGVHGGVRPTTKLTEPALSETLIDLWKGEWREYDESAQLRHFSMTRPRGNPNWGKPLAPLPAGATEFENMVKRLRLGLEMYAASPELRRWCHLNRNRCYVPEWLLQEWGMDVEIGYGNDAA